jgi:hypothetical protein
VTFENRISMKRFIAGGVLCGALVSALAGQTPMPKYGVTVEAEKGVDFAAFKTYTWTPGQPSAIPSADAAIVAAVDRELGSLGMTKAASGPGDVLVSYFSITRTDVDLKARPDSKGIRPQYSVGTLMVALLEPASRRRLLRLRMDTPLDTAPDKLEAEINSGVAAMFQKYPTRPKK